MSGHVVYLPPSRHACAPGWTWKPITDDGPRLVPSGKGGMFGTPPTVSDYPRGTVWECECGVTWVSRGAAPTPANVTFASGMEPVEWKRESRRARRKRERQSITPEQVRTIRVMAHGHVSPQRGIFDPDLDDPDEQRGGA